MSRSDDRDVGGLWEGLGGPIRMEAPRSSSSGYDPSMIDPTLDSCCRRDEEEASRALAMKRTLQRFDVVAARERIRKFNLVSTPAFVGCRCSYDPNSDGGEYRALIELRSASNQQQQEPMPDQQDQDTFDAEEDKKEDEREEKKIQTNSEFKKVSNDGNNSDDDDEFDYLLDEDLPENSELKLLEERRRAELEMALFSKEVALQHGYGCHRQMHPTRVLKAAGLAPGTRDPPPAVVLHLFDPDSISSASLDLYLEQLASSSSNEDARGTKFLRSGGRSVLLMDSELARRALPHLRPDSDMPTLMAIRDGVVVNTCPGLRGLLDPETHHVVPEAVYEWLDRSGVLRKDPPVTLEEMCRIRPEEDALMDYIMAQKSQQQQQQDDDYSKRFDCGLATCNKDFPHQHVGISTEQQAGLVIPEEEVIGKD